jgi:predicted transcriptional regulator
MIKSLSEIATLAGVSLPAVSQAVKRKKLKKTGKGIETEDDLTKTYLSQASGRRRSEKVKKGITSLSLSEHGQSKSTVSVPTSEHGQEYGSKPSFQDETYEEAALREKIERADKLALENMEKRGELIKRATVHTFISRLYAIDTAQFLTRGDRMAPILVGKVRSIESDDEATIKVNDLLTDDAYKEQDHKKKLVRDFLRVLKMPDDITAAPS